jgi:hypothetical protein
MSPRLRTREQTYKSCARSKTAVKHAMYTLLAAVFMAATLTAIANAGPYTGKIRGTFDRSCLTCISDPGHQLLSRLVTANVWCAWQDGHVIVHVTMHNGSVEHITVQWNPIYTIRNGGEHGQGFGSQQSKGFDGGETRSFYIKQDPKGVPANSPLASCHPNFWNIKSG